MSSAYCEIDVSFFWLAYIHIEQDWAYNAPLGDPFFGCISFGNCLIAFNFDFSVT